MYFTDERDLKANWEKVKNRKKVSHTFSDFPRPGVALRQTDVAGYESNSTKFLMLIPIKNWFEDCPRNLLRAFSGKHCDLSQAIQEFPEHKEELSLLQHLLQNEDGYRIMEMCLCAFPDQKKQFVQLIIKTHKEKKQKVQANLEKLGLIKKA